MKAKVACIALMCSFVWFGCSKEKPANASEPGGESAAPGEAVAAEEPLAYTPPAALGAAEVKAQYGPGKSKKTKKAKKLNTAAIKARRKGDTATAMKKYKEALKTFPGYITARFNLACEYARFGKADAAIGELEHLFRMGTSDALKRIAKLKSDEDFDPIRQDPRIKAISTMFRIHSVDWEIKFKDPQCTEGCDVNLKVLVNRDGKPLKPITITPGENAGQLSFSIDTDHYGHCVDKDKDKGALCAGINFDCGDSCYQDKIIVRAAGEGAKRTLQVVRYEGCMGGEECPDESTTIHEMPLKAFDQVLAKKYDMDPSAALKRLNASFRPADLRELYQPAASISLARKALHSWDDVTDKLDSMFGRATYEGEWDEDFEEGFDGWHLNVPETWDCKKLCCSPSEEEQLCAGSLSPPSGSRPFPCKAAGRLALKSLTFGDCSHY